METLKLSERKGGEKDTATSEYAEVMRELESMKRELNKLIVDTTSILLEKRRAEQEIETSRLEMTSNLTKLNSLSMEIERLNEDHVLIELAKIEAIKEYGETEAQRREISEKYKVATANIEKKKKKMIREIENAKELEKKLSITLSDIAMLQGGLKLVREMEERTENNGGSFKEGDEDGKSLLISVMEELEAGKKELVASKGDSFQLMASMDVVRNELKQVLEEMSRLRKKEEKTEVRMKNLNSKLLIAKAKMEATSATEEKTNMLVSNLLHSLDQLKTETETARKDCSVISEETVIIKGEIDKAKCERDSAEKRLEAAMNDLKAAKSSEARALENLKAQSEITIRNRASASQHGSTITISKFEYDYLIGRGEESKKIADKKVAAARAWVNALKASEREITIKTALLHRETRELLVEEEHQVHTIEQSTNAMKLVENELSRRQKVEPESLRTPLDPPVKPINQRFKMVPGRKSSVQGRTPSFALRRRKKVRPTLAKFLGGKRDFHG